MSTIKKIEETIYKKVFGFTDEDLKNFITFPLFLI